MHADLFSGHRIEKISNRRKILSVKIDMTPMVDLGFLLISFFVITTELTKPKALNLVVPKDGKSQLLGESNALTIMLSEDDKIFYYKGKFSSEKIYQTDFSGNGLRKIISNMQHEAGNNRNDLMILIKAGDAARYQRLVDVMDEILILQVKKYAIVPISFEELSVLNSR